MSDAQRPLTLRSGKRRQQFLVGEKIRELRKSRSLTQAELAARIGVQQSDLCRMETGEYKVGLDTLFRILAIFVMNIGEFFHESSRDAAGEELEILGLWRTLDARRRQEVRDFMIFKSRMTEEE